MSEIQQFKNMIKDYPFLNQFWNFDKNEVNIEGLKAQKSYLSQSQKILAGFFLLVWFHEDRADFPITMINAIDELSQKEISMITNWMNNPFWP